MGRDGMGWPGRWYGTGGGLAREVAWPGSAIKLPALRRLKDASLEPPLPVAPDGHYCTIALIAYAARLLPLLIMYPRGDSITDSISVRLQVGAHLRADRPKEVPPLVVDAHCHVALLEKAFQIWLRRAVVQDLFKLQPA